MIEIILHADLTLYHSPPPPPYPRPWVVLLKPKSSSSPNRVADNHVPKELPKHLEFDQTFLLRIQILQYYNLTIWRSVPINVYCSPERDKKRGCDAASWSGALWANLSAQCARAREREIGSQDSWPLACLTGISCDYKREAAGFNTTLLRNAKIRHFLFRKTGFREFAMGADSTFHPALLLTTIVHHTNTTCLKYQNFVHLLGWFPPTTTPPPPPSYGAIKCLLCDHNR